MSVSLPHLSTARLLLRALETDQAEALFRLANGPKIADNTASMEKIGLRYEGCMREAFLKNGVFEDLLGFAVVRDDWERRL